MQRSTAMLFLGIVMIFAFSSTGCTQNSSEGGDGPNYEIRKSEHAGGTGRYYQGREIADLKLDEHGAAWLDRATRETADLPDRVVRGLDLGPNDLVADIGAGSGYYTFRLSALLPHGRVYAVDIESTVLNALYARMDEEGIRNIEPVLGTASDPKLPRRALDLVLIVASYHEFTHPYEMMQHIKQALKPGGLVVLVEYRGEDTTIPVPAVHRMTEEQAIKEMKYVGLSWVETKEILPQQHFMVFQKPLH